MIYLNSPYDSNTIFICFVQDPHQIRKGFLQDFLEVLLGMKYLSYLIIIVFVLDSYMISLKSLRAPYRFRIGFIYDSYTIHTGFVYDFLKVRKCFYSFRLDSYRIRIGYMGFVQDCVKVELGILLFFFRVRMVSVQDSYRIRIVFP